MNIRPALRVLMSLVVPALTATPAVAGSHLWVVNEIFSNADGSVQFIEMHVPSNASNEILLGGKWVRSLATGTQFNFPDNLPSGSTAFAYLLLATDAFAALPGAPTPDYIIPSDFFDLNADTIKYWTYVSGDLTFAAGELPLDGVTSLNRDGTTGTNSPTNFNGETGSVNTNPTAVSDDGLEAPEADFFLHVLAAQPSRGPVQIEFQVPEASVATVHIVDANGRLIRRVFEQETQGRVRVTWDGRDDSGKSVASGVYLIWLEANDRKAVRKVALVR